MQHSFINKEAFKHDDIQDFKVNSAVEHAVFGQGVILAIEGLGAEQKITIRFRGRQIKKLIKKYANLKKI